MLLSTNKIQPKVNHRFDKYLKEEKGKDGNPTGNIISSIPKNVFTTSQDRVKNRPARALPHSFPGVRIVQQKTPGMIFMQTSDLEDMRRRAENEKRKVLMAKKAKIKADVPIFSSAPFEKAKAKRGRPKKK